MTPPHGRLEDLFGARFLAEAERLGVPITLIERARLSRCSRDQVLQGVKARMPAINHDLFRLLSERGPETLARGLASDLKREPGILSSAGDLLDSAETLDILSGIVASIAGIEQS